MKPLLPLLLFICLAVSGFSQSLICTIQSEKPAYMAGQVPKITIGIKNNTDSTIYLVKSLDASSHKWRYPYAYYKIELVGDTSYLIDKHVMCGNYNDIKIEDFFEVKSGEIFDPYRSHAFTDHSIENERNFVKRGKYRITFYYSTNQTGFKYWLGDAGLAGLKKEKIPEYEKMLDLFKKVPKVELESNAVFVEIK